MASPVAQRVKNPQRRGRFDSWVGKFPWRKNWQPAPVFLLEKSHGHRSLVGYSSWGCKDSDTAEQLSTAQRDGTDEPICRAAVETQRVDLWTWWGRRRWDKWREEQRNRYTIIRKIEQCEFSVWLKRLKPVLCDNAERWNVVGVGKEVLGARVHMYTCGWFMLMYGRNQHNIVQQLSFN